MAAAETQEEPEELARFRREWREEVQRKVHQEHPPPPPEPVPEPPHEHQLPSLVQALEKTSISEAKEPQAGRVNLNPKQAAALEVYSRAIAAEQHGTLDVALQLYQQAFRACDHVDSLWRIADRAANANQAQSESAAPSDAPSAPTTARALEHTPHATVVSGTLATLVTSFELPLTFTPEDERLPVLLARIPDELLVAVLCSLHDHNTLERFAAVSRKARVVSLDAAIWRELVYATYKLPQVPLGTALPTIVDQYAGDYRRMYIEHPRVRFDGVYIAVCHYIRNGSNENPWVNVSHLITYHRYLRFYPDGRVLSVLANESDKPEVVVPQLKESLRMKGMSAGTWHLTHGSPALVHVARLSGDGGTSKRYEFEMTLAFGSRPRGRWNRLSMVMYESVARDGGERTPLSLKHERPFWFSRVRSFGSGLE